MGFSTDDPDGDGSLNEISEGDLDLAEWFMLNLPQPAFAGTQGEYQRGVRLLEGMGCATCHIPDWSIEPAKDGYAGDRRVFDFQTRWNRKKGRLEGRLEPLYRRSGDSYLPRRGGYEVKGLFTDFLQHDMGDGFAELAFDGNENRVWRTAPLWGVGSGFPWGHDGRSLTLDHVIRRHGGAAAASAARYATVKQRVRNELLTFLSKLVLYDIESLPADVDGDGQISASYVVQGEDTGFERFNAEWLFRVPARIQGNVFNNDGLAIRSDAVVNLTEAYGLDLPWRVDTDLDGWPDVWDQAPDDPGFKDGAR